MTSDFQIILPEILLAIFAMGALMFAVYTGKDKVAPLLTWATAAAFVVLALIIIAQGAGAQQAFGGLFIDDAFSRFAKVTILIVAALICLMGRGSLESLGKAHFEYPILIALAVLGMMFMVSAGDLMMLYMGLELQ